MHRAMGIGPTRFTPRHHANLLHEHSQNMATISEEVVNCQLLLENIFPQEVLERLKQRDGGGGDRHAAVLAEEFHGCTFLFAKVADPASLPLPHTPTPNANPSPTPSSSPRSSASSS